MALATLSIDLVAKLGQLQQGMDKAGRLAEKNAAQIEARYKRMGDIARQVGAALGAAISVAGITAFVKSTIDGVAQLKALKDATGASIENLSALEDIATRTGTSMDEAGKAIVKLNQSLIAAKPNSPQAQAIEAIGLSVEELNRLDPAEALRRVAVALAGYADDGARARVEQVLFGEQIRIIAPLLRNLGEAGEYNATITTEQALAAEKFNNQLASLEKNATDASRAIVLELLPALNRYLEVLARLPQNVAIVGAANKAVFESETLALAVSRVERLQNALNRDPKNDRLAQQLADARAEADRLLASALKTGAALKALIPAPAPGAGGGRGFVNPELVRPQVVGNAAAAAAGTTGGSRPPRAGAGPGYGPMGPFQPEEINVPLSEAARDALRAIESTDLAKIQRINDTLDQLMLMEATGGGADVVEAIAQLRAELDAMAPAAEQVAIVVPEALAEISTFAEEASRNVQDALGDTLQATLSGNFDSIGDLWQNMLTRMAAEAAAAQLNKYLFGSGIGKGDGAIDLLFSFLGSFGGSGSGLVPGRPRGGAATGSNYVERDMLTILHKGEAVIPAKYNARGGAGNQFSVVVQGDASENTVRLINGALAQFEARMMMRGA